VQTPHRPDPLTQASLADPQGLTRGQLRQCAWRDDRGTLVENMGREVHVLPAARMSSRTGVAASLRHKTRAPRAPQDQSMTIQASTDVDVDGAAARSG